MRISWLAVLVVVLVAGCAEGEAPISAAVTSSESIALDSPAASGCPGETGLPSDALVVRSFQADFDADGMVDTLSAYHLAEQDVVRLRYEPGSGGAWDQVIGGSHPDAAHGPIGGADIDGDGTLESFVMVNNGASAIAVGIYDMTKCDFSRVILDGAPFVFYVGGSVMNLAGLRCPGDGGIEVVTPSIVDASVPDDELVYGGDVVSYELTGSELQVVAISSMSWSVEDVLGVGRLNCGPIVDWGP